MSDLWRLSLSPSPHPSWGMHTPGWLALGSGTICADFSPLWLLQTSCYTLLWEIKASPLSWLISHECEDFSGCRNISSFTTPFQGCKSHPDSFLTFFFLLSYPVMWRFSCFFKRLRFSASIQQIFYESHSTCWFISAVSVRGDESYRYISEGRIEWDEGRE